MSGAGFFPTPRGGTVVSARPTLPTATPGLECALCAMQPLVAISLVVRCPPCVAKEF